MMILNYEILKLSWKFKAAVRYRIVRNFQCNQKESLNLLVTSVNKFTTVYAIRSSLPRLLHLWQSGLKQSKLSHATPILCSNFNVTMQVRTLKVHRVKFHMHYPFPSLYCTPRSLYPRAKSFDMSVCPSAWKNWLPLDGFSLNYIFEYLFLKICPKIHVYLKYYKNNRHFTWRPLNTDDTCRDVWLCIFLM